MEYELGKKLDNLELQNGYLANEIAKLQIQVKQLLEIVQSEVGEVEPSSKPRETRDPDQISSTELESPNESAKRGRGRPRKETASETQPQ